MSTGTVVTKGRALGSRTTNIQLANKADEEFKRILEDFEFLKSQANQLQNMVGEFQSKSVSCTWFVQASKFERNVAIFIKHNSFYVALEYCNLELEKFVNVNSQIIQDSIDLRTQSKVTETNKHYGSENVDNPDTELDSIQEQIRFAFEEQ